LIGNIANLLISWTFVFVVLQQEVILNRAEEVVGFSSAMNQRMVLVGAALDPADSIGAVGTLGDAVPNSQTVIAKSSEPDQAVSFLEGQELELLAAGKPVSRCSTARAPLLESVGIAGTLISVGPLTLTGGSGISFWAFLDGCGVGFVAPILSVTSEISAPCSPVRVGRLGVVANRSWINDVHWAVVSGGLRLLIDVRFFVLLLVVDFLGWLSLRLVGSDVSTPVSVFSVARVASAE